MHNNKEGYKREFFNRLIKFSIRLVKFGDLLKVEKISFCLIDQLLRAGTSIGANIIEAKSAHSTKDYIKFFEIALKSANETKYWLIVIDAITENNKKESNKLLKEAIEIANIIASGVLTMKGKK